MNLPPFVPAPVPLGRFVLFLLAPGAGVGARLAACHDDDFDDLLIAVPGGAETMWQIYDLETGRICASSDPAQDKTFPPITGTGRLLLFAPRDDAWGAWCLTGRADVAPMGSQFIGTETSTIFEGDRLIQIVPALQQITAYQQSLAQWRMEHLAEMPAETDDDSDAEAQSWIGGGKLPPGWEELETEELRRLVEAAEAEVGS